MTDTKTVTTPPELIKAKKVLDAVLAVQPSFDGIPTEEDQKKISRKIYHERMMIIYLELVNTAMEARSERH